MATVKRRKAYMRNFEQYIIKGLIANLHRIYYNRRKNPDCVLRSIGLAIDTLTDLAKTLKEHDYDCY